MTKHTTFSGYVTAVASETHPLQSRLRFIFTDFSPNANKQGVPREEAENIINSALYMPVKVNFDGDDYHGHSGAFPVGPIVEMREEDGVLIAEARVWKDEFPELVDYLESKASAEVKDINFSWELYYKDSSVDDSGVEWLRGCVVAGTTIVDTPAYQGRTHLLAMAEEGRKMDELEAQVNALASRLYAMVDTLWAALALPGAVDRAKDIEEQFNSVIEALSARMGSAEIATSELDVAKTELEAAKSQLETLTVELDALRAFRADVENQAARAELIKTRRNGLSEAGIVMTEEVFESKTDFIIGMTDEQFADYVDTLRSVANNKSAAEVKNNVGVVPDPLIGGQDKRYDIPTLAKKLRKEARTAAK